MEYLVVDFTIKTSEEMMQIARDVLSAQVAEVGFDSFEEIPEGIRGYVQREQFLADMLDEKLDELFLPEVKVSYTVEEAENRNWNEEWEQAGFEPILIGNSMIVYDAKNTDEEQTSAYKNTYKHAIGIDAVQAFGTGTHQTTQLVLETLLSLPLEGKRVLDCGCGTGILSIAALKFGAAAATAYDIDEWSVENTRHNAEINGVIPDIMHGNATILSHVSGFFDVVMANINRNILLEDIPTWSEVMPPSSHLLVSGFYEEDADIVSEHAQNVGFKETSRTVRDNWCCILLEK